MSGDLETIKVKAWAKRAEYLQSRLSDQQEIFVIYQQDFSRVIRIAAGNIRVEQDIRVLKKNIEAAAAAKKSKSLEEIKKETEVKPGEKDPGKSLYRKIALETHPDRQVALNNSKEDVLKKEEMFKQAMLAHEEKNIPDLLMIGIKLGMNPLDLGFSVKELRKIYEKMEKKINVEIKKIESSYVWVWGESEGNIPLRLNLLDAYLRQTGHPPVDKSILRDIIEHHESSANEMVPASRQRKVGKRPKKLLR